MVIFLFIMFIYNNYKYILNVLIHLKMILISFISNIKIYQYFSAYSTIYYYYYYYFYQVTSFKLIVYTDYIFLLYIFIYIL